MGFDFGTVYVRDVSFIRVREALVELMEETERIATQERGIEPTPESDSSHKRVRSFAILPEEDAWIAIVEDGHSRDDGGVAEGLSELLQAESLHLAYSDDECAWSFVRYWEGQPLEAGGADDSDYDAGALEFISGQALPHFGVYYEEIAASAGADAPSLAGSNSVIGDIIPKVPIGTEILTFRRPGKPLPI